MKHQRHRSIGAPSYEKCGIVHFGALFAKAPLAGASRPPETPPNPMHTRPPESARITPHNRVSARGVPTIRLQGKVALISGAARGMGAVEARMFATEGAAVVLADLLDERGQAVAEEITESGGQAVYVHLDVADEAAWQSAVQAATDEFGKLDVLVNNAGIVRTEQVMETTDSIWEDVMSVNAKGVFLGTKAAIPSMRAAGGGSIVNISSIAGLVGTNLSAAYHASKGAVRIFTKAAAVQYAPYKIRVNSVHPGMIDTDMVGTPGVGDVMDQRIAATPMRRIGRPEEIAYGVLYLASDESSFVTGSELVIDGGRTAQ